MSVKNLRDYAVELANEALRGYEFIDVVEQLENLTDEECEQVHDLITGEVETYVATEPRIIRTVEELEALAKVDAEAVVVSSDIGSGYIVEPAFKLCVMYKIGYVRIFPSVVVTTGEQVRAAREAMGKELRERIEHG